MVDGVRGWIARTGAGRHGDPVARRQRRRPGVRDASSRPWRWPGRGDRAGSVLRRRGSTTPAGADPRRGGDRRPDRRRGRRWHGPGDPRPAPGRPGAGRPRPAAAHRAAHGGRRADGGGRRARRGRRSPTPSWRASPRSRASAAGSSSRATSAGVVVLDDYAHHPTAMRATFEAARQRYPGRRLWAVYEPLTYHRTAAMLDRFAEVLAEADRAAVIDIWAVRDPDTTITSAQALADATTRAAAGPGHGHRQPRGTAPPGSPSTSSPATSSWSWAAAGRTWPRSSSSSGCAPDCLTDARAQLAFVGLRVVLGADRPRVELVALRGEARARSRAPTASRAGRRS